MTTIFKQLGDMLKHDEKIQFSLTKQGNQLNILVQPVLKGNAEGLPEAACQLRAALAMPLYVTADADTLDADFAGCLQQYKATRTGVQSSLNAAMSRVKESAKEAQATPAHDDKSGKQPSSPPASNPSVDSTVSEKSLF